MWKETRDRSRSQQQDQQQLLLSSPRLKAEHKKLNTVESGGGTKRSKVYSETDPAVTGERQRSQQPAKGVPASFGYVKKNTAYPGLDIKRNGDPMASSIKAVAYKTANVAAVPKLVGEADGNGSGGSAHRSLERPKTTRLKVSGGTQTDLAGGRILKPSQQHQYKSSSSSPAPSPALANASAAGSYSDSGTNDGDKLPTGFKSYSLTAPIANQLSHNIRERLLLNGTQSLPKSHFNHLTGVARGKNTLTANLSNPFNPNLLYVFD